MLDTVLDDPDTLLLFITFPFQDTKVEICLQNKYLEIICRLKWHSILFIKKYSTVLLITPWTVEQVSKIQKLFAELTLSCGFKWKTSTEFLQTIHSLNFKWDAWKSSANDNYFPGYSWPFTSTPSCSDNTIYLLPSVFPERKMANSQEYFPIKQNKYHPWLKITLKDTAGL